MLLCTTVLDLGLAGDLEFCYLALAWYHTVYQYLVALHRIRMDFNLKNKKSNFTTQPNQVET